MCLAERTRWRIDQSRVQLRFACQIDLAQIVAWSRQFTLLLQLFIEVLAFWHHRVAEPTFAVRAKRRRHRVLVWAGLWTEDALPLDLVNEEFFHL